MFVIILCDKTYICKTSISVSLYVKIMIKNHLRLISYDKGNDVVGKILVRHLMS